MNTSKLKTFAQQSRRILMEGVKQKLRYWGFNQNGEVIDELQEVSGGVIIKRKNNENLQAEDFGVLDDPTILPKWKALQSSIRRHGVEATIEEAAYTWFNRLMAIRILSKNGYDPAQLEYEGDGSHLPVILAKARRGMTAYLTKEEQERLQVFLTDYSQETKAFAILITGYCHSHKLLNRVFGRLNDFTELLLPDNILAEKGFIHLLNTTDAIAEDDYKEVELIGWLYQFYISEKKDEVFKGFKKNKKAEAEDIPAATQIFTPNWIVKYMVQNTAGRIWLDHHPDSALRDKMKYLVEPPAENSSDNQIRLNSSEPPTEGESSFSKGGVERQRDGGFTQAAEPSATDHNENPPESPFSQGGRAPMNASGLLKDSDPIHLKLLDPATGSGHILVEGFSLLYEMYMEEFYMPAEAVENILTKNLLGLELDLRAAQLARFAVLLAAAKKEPEILKKDILPRIYAMPEPAEFSRQEILDFLGEDGTQHEKVLTNALQLMQQAQNLGSVMQFNVKDDELRFFKQRWKTLPEVAKTNITTKTLVQKLEPFLNIFFALTGRYEAIAANPPYMGDGNMNEQLKLYLNLHYKEVSNDLMTTFMVVSNNLCSLYGKWSLINIHNWLTKKEFEGTRKFLIESQKIDSLLHFGRGVFGSDFGTVGFCVSNVAPNLISSGYYRKLFDIFVKVENPEIKEKRFLDYEKNVFINKQFNFKYLPGFQIGYWLKDNIFNILKESTIKKIGDAKQGIKTGDNDRFIRFWYEVDYSFSSLANSSTQQKWFPLNKGGDFRKWYGNDYFFLNWENDGHEIRNFRNEKGKLKSRPQNIQYFFKEGATWSTSASYKPSFRYSLDKFTFESSGSMFFVSSKNTDIIEVLAFLNTKTGEYLLDVFSLGKGITEGAVKSLPFIESHFYVKGIAEKCIKLTTYDWNSHETSWDFQAHPILLKLITIRSPAKNDFSLENSYDAWEEEVTQQFFQLHANEEELNRIFIDIYGLNKELDPVVPLKDITILQEELDRSALEKTEQGLRKRRRWKLEEGKWQLYVDDELVLPPAEGELPPATVQPELPIKKDVVMRQFISYAIGCMMGRYSLDKPGLILANQGETLEDYLKKVELNEEEVSYLPDDDAIIPLMSSNCGFSDDAVYRLRHFIEVVWRSETLTQNINFLQAYLDMDMEKYLVNQNHFWKDHCNRYKKKPIYWLFSSKKGAFQALVYMHRMNKFTVQKIRDNYLLKHLQWLNTQINQLESSNTRDREEQRQLDYYRKALDECEEYNNYLKDIADQQIEIDLDDGVAVNYPKFEPVVAKIK